MLSLLCYNSQASIFGTRISYLWIYLIMDRRESADVVFLGNEKAFDTAWHYGLLYKLSKLHFSASLIKLIISFLSNRKFRVMVKCEISKPREIQGGVPRGSVLAPILYILYVNDTPKTPGVHLSLFADNICSQKAATRSSLTSEYVRHKV
jgi:hypothetical protein